MFKSAERPRCRWCGKPIAKATNYHSVSNAFHAFKENKLTTLEDCQKKHNEKIVSVKYHHETESTIDGYARTGRRTVYSYATWDGESYKDGFFCNGEHAQLMGYAAAEKGWSTKAYRTSFLTANKKEEDAA